MSRGDYRRTISRSALLLLLGLTTTGCALFTKSPGELVTKAFKLPTVSIPADAIQFAVVYVERPLGDAKLGDELWKGVDEISCVEPEQRAMLKRNGFRAGVVGTNPPPALQQMLGLKDDFVYEPEAEKSKQFRGNMLVVRSGSQQTIMASPLYPECTLDIPQGEQTQHRSLENAQCKYRVTAKRLQEGWVEFDFVPQIHHGPNQTRRVVGEDGAWQFQEGQKTETLFPQRFTMRLHVGEMAMLTANDAAEGRLGELFFRGPAALASTEDGVAPRNADAPLTNVQRLLIVRLNAMGNADGPHATAASR